jgi:nickel transport protein
LLKKAFQKDSSMKAIHPFGPAASRIALASAIAFALALSLCPGASAHGVVWDYSAKKTVGLEFAYDDNTPMRYAEINVFGPDDETKLSQIGRTDKNGYFAFIPDADGKWVVTSNDGEGHLAKADLTVASAASGEAAEAAPPAVNAERIAQAASKPYKIVMIVSLFLNAGLASYALKRGKPSLAKG